MKHLKSTILHVAEFVIVYLCVVGIALLVRWQFDIDVKSNVEMATTLVLNGVLKFLRSNPGVPLKDYVNE